MLPGAQLCTAHSHAKSFEGPKDHSLVLSILRGAQDTQALPPPRKQGAQGRIQLPAPCPAPLPDPTHRSQDPKGSGTGDGGCWPHTRALKAWEAWERWPRACWSPASPEWKLLPADGCWQRAQMGTRGTSYGPGGEDGAGAPT